MLKERYMKLTYGNDKEKLENIKLLYPLVSLGTKSTALCSTDQCKQ